MTEPKKRGRGRPAGGARHGGRTPSGTAGKVRDEVLSAKVTNDVKEKWQAFVKSQGCKSFGAWVEQFAADDFPIAKNPPKKTE